MAVVETQREQSTSVDDAVFVAHDGRRARRLRNVAVVAGVLAILWIVGLAVGMLGFGSLPGVALVKGEQRHSRSEEPVAPARAERKASRLFGADVRSVRRQVARDTAVSPAVPTAAQHRAAGKTVARRRAATTPAASAGVSVNPAQRSRGWSRKGYTAPRGQLRKAAPPPPPVTSRGRRVGPQKTLPAPPPPVPPGQTKKAAQPPPPPPPPPKKG